MIFRRAYLATVLMAAASFTACGGPDPAEEAKEPLNVTFGAFQRSDLEGALVMYSPTFFQSTPRQAWLNQLRQIHQSIGPVLNYTILETVADKKTQPVPGTYVRFKCKVDYQHGSLIETIVLVRPERLQHFTISSHSISPLPNQSILRTPPPQQQQQLGGQPPPPQPQTPDTHPPDQPQTPPPPTPGSDANTPAPPSSPQSPPAELDPVPPPIPNPFTPAPPEPPKAPPSGDATPPPPPSIEKPAALAAPANPAESAKPE